MVFLPFFTGYSYDFESPLDDPDDARTGPHDVSMGMD